MKRLSIIPTTLVAMLAIAGIAQAQSVTIAANTPGITLRGTSGGPRQDNSCAKFIASAPNHQIQVTEDSNLRFNLQAAGQPALLIRGPLNLCVQADTLSGGKLSVPGRWPKGSYSVYVGDRANGQNPYVLSITPN